MTFVYTHATGKNIFSTATVCSLKRLLSNYIISLWEYMIGFPVDLRAYEVKRK